MDLLKNTNFADTKIKDMKRLYLIMVLCLVSVMSISAQSQWDTLKEEVDKAFDEKNYVEAVKGLKLLAYDAHDTDAMKFLAKCYLGMYDVKPDNKKRIELLEMAADGGDVEAMLYLLREYYQKNHKKYMSVMDRMDNEVKKGNTQAMDVLAHMYEEGDGAPKEPTLASYYRQKYNMANAGKIFSEFHNQGASNNTPSSSPSEYTMEETFNVVATDNLDRHIEYGNVALGVSPEEFLEKAVDPNDEWCWAELIEGEEINKEDGSFVFSDIMLGTRVAIYGSCDKNRKVTRIEAWIPVEGFKNDIPGNIEMLKDNVLSRASSGAFMGDLFTLGPDKENVIRGYKIALLINKEKGMNINNIYGVVEMKYDDGGGESDPCVYVSFTDHTDAEKMAELF